MKKIHLLLIGAALLAACQSKPKTEASAATATPDYPYKVKYPDNWLIDTTHTNTLLALNALKSYETKDTALMNKVFADSVEFKYDGGIFKGKKADFIKMAAGMFASMKTIKLDVYDWEAVTGKTNKEDWVSVWYTEHDTDLKGKTDSIEYVNDFLIKGGKIVRLDEYGRNFKPKTK